MPSRQSLPEKIGKACEDCVDISEEAQQAYQNQSNIASAEANQILNKTNMTNTLEKATPGQVINFLA